MSTQKQQQRNKDHLVSWKKRQETVKSNEMPTGIFQKMMTNKQFKVIDPITEKIVGWMIYAAMMANIDYSLYDNVPSLSMCNNTPSFHLTLCPEMEYDQQVIEMN